MATSPELRKKPSIRPSSYGRCQPAREWVGAVGAQRGLLEDRVQDAVGVGLGEAGRRAEAARLRLRGEAEVAVEGAVLLAGDDEVADRRVVATVAARPGRGRGGRPQRPAEQRHA